MKLIIVESPTKSNTIQKFLDKNYKVLSSYGHVRDLPEKKLGIDTEHNFEPQYVILPKAKINHQVKAVDFCRWVADSALRNDFLFRFARAWSPNYFNAGQAFAVLGNQESEKGLIFNLFKMDFFLELF